MLATEWRPYFKFSVWTGLSLGEKAAIYGQMSI